MGWRQDPGHLAACLPISFLSRRSSVNGESVDSRRSIQKAHHNFLKSALSGLDIALWDIKGKKLGVPVWQLLGGKVRDRLKVYGWIGGDSPQAVVQGARERKAQGFTAVKMNGTGLSSRSFFSQIFN